MDTFKVHLAVDQGHMMWLNGAIVGTVETYLVADQGYLVWFNGAVVGTFKTRPVVDQGHWVWLDSVDNWYRQCPLGCGPRAPDGA